MGNRRNARGGVFRTLVVWAVLVIWGGVGIAQQAPAPNAAAAPAAKAATSRTTGPARPKLVVMIVVDQMRGDYVDKFQGQWSGGLKRLVNEGAWFHAAAYPYSSTETCPGHATISTGAFPASHGIVGNSWWERQAQQMVTCTSDPNTKNLGYAGHLAKGGDSAWRIKLPSFAEELKFQSGSGTRVVTFSLKARAAISLAGHKADAVTWEDGATGTWVTSAQYGAVPFVEQYVQRHPITEDFGKTWSLSLPKSSYLYDEKALGAGSVNGWNATFPRTLRGKEGSGPDAAFYEQWGLSPFADTYLTKLAETAVDSLTLGKGAGIDYLGVSYSTTDYVGHRFGPRSWEIQDILVRLDKDLAELFAHLDQKVGRGNYVVALTADHGVAPNPADMQTTGFDAGVLSLPELKDKIERTLHTFNYPDPSVAKMVDNQVYFSDGAYAKLKQDPAAMEALKNALESTPGVAAVYRAEELADGTKSVLGPLAAAELSYFPSRSGDLFILQQPYWLPDGSTDGKRGYSGTGHGAPYYYDQHVPLLLMGFGIKPGEYFQTVTPADIAPTFAALTGVTLATHDGRILGEALKERVGSR